MTAAGPRHAALVGSTATGKSAVAIELARADPRWEIVSIDSMQVYRRMDIGTAKPSRAERDGVPHHLIDIVEPWEDHDVATHQHLVGDVVARLESEGKRALLVGGTALYLRAVVDDLELPGRFPEIVAELDEVADTLELHRRLADVDPVGATRMEPSNRRRVLRALSVSIGTGRPFSSFGPGLTEHPPTPFAMVALRRARQSLDALIDARVDDQLADGLLDEVRALMDDDRGLSRTASQALGYKELGAHLRRERELADAVAVMKQRTRRFSRRQDKWFRRDPRIRWVDVEQGDTAHDVAAAVASMLDG